MVFSSIWSINIVDSMMSGEVGNDSNFVIKESRSAVVVNVLETGSGAAAAVSDAVVHMVNFEVLWRL